MNSTADSNKVAPEGFNLFLYRTKSIFSGPDPYLTIAGVFLWLFAYWVLCEGLQIWRFTKLPGPVAISRIGSLQNHFKVSRFLRKSITITFT